MNRAPFRWSATAGAFLTLWRGGSRTMPMGALEVTEEELAELLRRRGWSVKR